MRKIKAANCRIAEAGTCICLAFSFINDLKRVVDRSFLTGNWNSEVNVVTGDIFLCQSFSQTMVAPLHHLHSRLQAERHHVKLPHRDLRIATNADQIINSCFHCRNICISCCGHIHRLHWGSASSPFLTLRIKTAGETPTVQTNVRIQEEENLVNGAR